MDLVSSLQHALSYIEEHIRDDDLGMQSIAASSRASPGELQKIFSVVTGMSVAEYIRCRRLYLAALDINSGTRVIDSALDYGYESPDSFTKAFSRFHGCNPREIKDDASKIKVFLPFSISISVDGGSSLNPEISPMPSFTLVGVSYEYTYANAKKMIPGFWQDFYSQKRSSRTYDFIRANGIGSYGICNDCRDESGTYVIAGQYRGGKIPEGFSLVEVPQLTWAKFRCTGPVPSAIQSMNSTIYRNWLATNGTYDLDGTLDIEWYSPEGAMSDLDYRSEIWLPVRKRS